MAPGGGHDDALVSSAQAPEGWLGRARAHVHAGGDGDARAAGIETPPHGGAAMNPADRGPVARAASAGDVVSSSVASTDARAGETVPTFAPGKRLRGHADARGSGPSGACGDSRAGPRRGVPRARP